MASQFFDMASLSSFFWPCFVFLVNFSYWFKFLVNIITGSGVVTVSFYKRLTRNPEIENISVWDLPNFWTLAQVRNTKFGTNFSNKMFLNAEKWLKKGYSFYRFWVITGKPTRRGRGRRGGKITLLHTWVNPVNYAYHTIHIEAQKRTSYKYYEKTLSNVLKKNFRCFPFLRLK